MGVVLGAGVDVACVFGVESGGEFGGRGAVVVVGVELDAALMRGQVELISGMKGEEGGDEPRRGRERV